MEWPKIKFVWMRNEILTTYALRLTPFIYLRVMLKAVIIDDVMQARAALKADLVDYCPTVEIVGEADGVASGLSLLKKVSLT